MYTTQAVPEEGVSNVTTTSNYKSPGGRSTPAPPNVTAIPLMMQSIASAGPPPSSILQQHTTLANMMAGTHHLSPSSLPSPIPSPSLPSPSFPSSTSVSNLNDPTSVVRSLMSSVTAAGNMHSTGSNNMANNMANNFQTSQNSGQGNGAGNVPNPVGMTAHALLETLLAQVIAHSMNGNAPNTPAAAGLPPSTPTTPNPAISFNSNVNGELS